MSKHTKGPWEVRPSSNPHNGTGWRDIVSTGEAFGPSYVGEALQKDAALISSAPCLLEALELAFSHISKESGNPYLTEPGKTIAAAIARARGQTV
jgi:hypothetical protein